VGMGRGVRAAAVAVAALVAGAGQAAAQGTSGGVEVLGVRAQGMAGAFVAVADDATAVYWNPAGLGTGDFVSVVVERSHVSLPDGPGGEPRAMRTGAILIGTPPLGAGYYRLGSTHVVPVTVVQSIGDHVNVGGAVKGVWGKGLDGATHAALDVDLGLMVRTEAWRAGLVVRNLTDPDFGPEVIAFGGGGFGLERHARAGVAVFPRDGLTIAADADLTALETAGGRWRAVAVGVEQRIVPRVVARGGVRVQTIDGARPSASAGVSVEVRPTMWADVQATGGGDDALRGWTAGLRIRF
jgi:hypothetical protein